MPTPRRAFAVVALAISLLVPPGSAYATRTIALSSGTFEFAVDAGGTGGGEVVVGNDGDEPLRVLVYATDLQIDARGDQTYTLPEREGANLVTTPASWFQIFMPEDSKAIGNTPYLELAPGASVPIRFEFTTPPASAPGDHNVVIFFEMFDTPDATDGSSAAVSGRLGARVQLRVNGTITERMTVRPFEVPTFVIGRTVPYQFVLNNEGNVNEKLLTLVSVMDSSDSTLTASQVATDTTIYAMSGKQYRGELTCPGAAIGPHEVWVNAFYVADGAAIATGIVEKRTVWMLPLWLVVLLAFLLAYAALYAFSTRAKKRRRPGRHMAGGRRRVSGPRVHEDGRLSE